MPKHLAISSILTQTHSDVADVILIAAIDNICVNDQLIGLVDAVGHILNRQIMEIQHGRNRIILFVALRLPHGQDTNLNGLAEQVLRSVKGAGNLRTLAGQNDRIDRIAADEQPIRVRDHNLQAVHGGFSDVADGDVHRHGGAVHDVGAVIIHRVHRQVTVDAPLLQNEAGVAVVLLIRRLADHLNGVEQQLNLAVLVHGTKGGDAGRAVREGHGSAPAVGFAVPEGGLDRRIKPILACEHDRAVVVTAHKLIAIRGEPAEQRSVPGDKRAVLIPVQHAVIILRAGVDHVILRHLRSIHKQLMIFHRVQIAVQIEAVGEIDPGVAVVGVHGDDRLQTGVSRGLRLPEPVYQFTVKDAVVRRGAEPTAAALPCDVDISVAAAEHRGHIQQAVSFGHVGGPEAAAAHVKDRHGDVHQSCQIVQRCDVADVAGGVHPRHICNAVDDLQAGDGVQGSVVLNDPGVRPAAPIEIGGVEPELVGGPGAVGADPDGELGAAREIHQLRRSLPIGVADENRVVVGQLGIGHRGTREIGQILHLIPCGVIQIRGLRCDGHGLFRGLLRIFIPDALRNRRPLLLEPKEGDLAFDVGVERCFQDEVIGLSAENIPCGVQRAGDTTAAGNHMLDAKAETTAEGDYAVEGRGGCERFGAVGNV